jgi:hypothetical protein
LHSESKCQQPAGDNNKFGVITTALLSLQGPFRQFAEHKSQSQRDYYSPSWHWSNDNCATATADCVHLYQKVDSIYASRQQILQKSLNHFGIIKYYDHWLTFINFFADILQEFSNLFVFLSGL